MYPIGLWQRTRSVISKRCLRSNVRSPANNPTHTQHTCVVRIGGVIVCLFVFAHLMIIPRPPRVLPPRVYARGACAAVIDFARARNITRRTLNTHRHHRKPNANTHNRKHVRTHTNANNHLHLKVCAFPWYYNLCAHVQYVDSLSDSMRIRNTIG